MSHFTKMTIQAQQKYEAELIEALKEHFGVDAVQVHEDKVHLKDYVGNQTSFKANLVITRKSQEKKIGHAAAVTELGYERNNSDSYDVHVDAELSRSHLDQVAQYYAEKVASKKLKMNGYAVKRATLDDGRIQLTATRYG